MDGVVNGAEDAVRSAGVGEAFVGEAAGTETRLLLHRLMNKSSLLVGDADGVNVVGEGDVVEVACSQILQDHEGRMATADWSTDALSHRGWQRDMGVYAGYEIYVTSLSVVVSLLMVIDAVAVPLGHLPVMSVAAEG